MLNYSLIQGQEGCPNNFLERFRMNDGEPILTHIKQFYTFLKQMDSKIDAEIAQMDKVLYQNKNESMILQNW